MKSGFPRKLFKYFGNFTNDDWGNWKWQVRNSITSLSDSLELLEINYKEINQESFQPRLPFKITPFLLNLILGNNASDAIIKQFIPHVLEQSFFSKNSYDPLSEDAYSPVEGLVHRYPDRVLLILTTHCSSYCRFCTRNRLIGTSGFSKQRFKEQLSYIRKNSAIVDVIISGGDPLLLDDSTLDHVLGELKKISQIQTIRINTRIPVVLPMRITSGLIDIMKRHKPVWINIHINHPHEISAEFRDSIGKLADNGFPLGSQSVLLAGVNDCPNIQKELVRQLLSIRVRPYYLYQCDIVNGTDHFRTPVSVGLNIMNSLIRHISGLAIPSFVIDCPQGGGKMPILPDYLTKIDHSSYELRSMQDTLVKYSDPQVYCDHNSLSCAYCKREP